MSLQKAKKEELKLTKRRQKDAKAAAKKSAEVVKQKIDKLQTKTDSNLKQLEKLRKKSVVAKRKAEQKAKQDVPPKAPKKSRARATKEEISRRNRTMASLARLTAEDPSEDDSEDEEEQRDARKGPNTRSKKGN